MSKYKERGEYALMLGILSIAFGINVLSKAKELSLPVLARSQRVKYRLCGSLCFIVGFYYGVYRPLLPLIRDWKES